MKKNNSTSPTAITLSMAVTDTTDTEGKSACRVYQIVQDAIDRNAAVIYNGNDETIEVPFIAHIQQMHPDFVATSPDYDGPFDGWDLANHIYMVEANRCTQDQFIDLVASRFSPDIVALWGETMKAAQEHDGFPIFLGEGCVALHIDNDDDSWFEYIIEG